MVKKILFAAFFMLNTVVFSNENVVIERPSSNLTLKIDEKKSFQTTISKSPYVVDNKGNYPGMYLTIYPGETLFVEADVVNDSIVKLTVVKEVKNKDKTITLKFEQTAKKENSQVHEMMMLAITNPFNKKLVYKANIYLPLKDKIVPTSIIPVMAKLKNFEVWPDIIGTIFLHSFVLE
jgi:hypothetical protein